MCQFCEKKEINFEDATCTRGAKGEEVPVAETPDFYLRPLFNYVIVWCINCQKRCLKPDRI